VRANDEEDGDSSRLGMKVRVKKNFGEEFLLSSSETLAKMLSDRELSDFLPTLTPGAQNAIYAASFAWGYENAAKCVKGVMKSEEVKNALEGEDKSRAVMESMKSQAHSSQSETQREVSSFVWSYYNEGLKESQAHGSKSEHMTSKAATEQQAIATPLSAREAASLSVSFEAHAPALLYCAAAQQAAEEEKERHIIEAKRSELVRIITNRQEKAAAGAKVKVEEEAEKIALERREGLVREYEKIERDLKEAVKALDAFSGTNFERFKRVCDMLPEELALALLAKEKGFERRGALRAQLVKWIAFARKGKRQISSISAGRLLKLAALSSLLRLGK